MYEFKHVARLQRMKFALLGSDTDSLLLAKAARALGHEIIWAGDIHDPTDFRTWLPNADRVLVSCDDDPHADWHSLLDRQMTDAVLVGRGSQPLEQRTTQLIQLARQGIHLLVTHPVVPSVLSYFEIDMAHREGRSVFRSFHPTMGHPVIGELARWVCQGHPQLGSVGQIVCERMTRERLPEIVHQLFSRDVLLLTSIAGGLNRLGAVGTTSEDARLASLNVQMTGQLEKMVHWSIGPVDDKPCMLVTLVGELGRLVLRVDETGYPTRLTLAREGKREELSLAGYLISQVERDSQIERMQRQEEISTSPTGRIGADVAADAIERFIGAMREGGTGKENVDSAEPWDHSVLGELPSLSSALMAMELTDTIEISLQKGRMIDVHQQELTERMAFRGTMSAVGCGMLVVLPILFITLGWLAGHMGWSVAHYWPHGLLLMMGSFLLLQLLPWMVGSSEKRAESEK